MNAKPILFSGPMVRAILAGTKTQTRRVVKPVPFERRPAHDCKTTWHIATDAFGGPHCTVKMPWLGGDILWVRETWRPVGAFDFYTTAKLSKKFHDPRSAMSDHLAFRATDDDGLSGWRPAIFMPRWASRITLRVISVRVERLIAISDSDAEAEGVEPTFTSGDDPAPSYVHAFRKLWDSINAKRAPWHSNPWVWVVEFSRA